MVGLIILLLFATLAIAVYKKKKYLLWCSVVVIIGLLLMVLSHVMYMRIMTNVSFTFGIDYKIDDFFTKSVNLSLSDLRLISLLVNNENAIPDNYEPKLVEVSGGEKVDERIYEPLMEMLEDAKKANWDQLPMVVSGYRTQEKQKKIVDDKIAEFRREGNSKSEAEELAKKQVAKPGYSEHQIGLAVDINGATYDLYFWLQENCYKYGFIFRYPGDKTDITGVTEEVWHYRYVGVEAATEIHERGICLEEYLEEKRMKQ